MTELVGSKDEVQSFAKHEAAWWVLLGASLCVFSGNASVPYYTFGIFLPEIISSTHWSAPAVAASIGPALLAAATVAPLVGWACDRVGVRTVVIVGAPAVLLGLALLGLAPGNAGEFTAAMVTMFILYFAGSPVPHAKLLSAWFDRRRGLALSVMFASGSLGIAVWPQYAAVLITRLGWRHAYIALGASAAAVILVAALALLRNPPAKLPAVGDRADVSLDGLLVGEALRTARFWKLAMVFLLLTGVLGGTAVVFPVVLRTRGADSSTAASIMSLVGAAMFLGRLSLGLTLDRLFAPTVTICITVIAIFGYAIMLSSTAMPALFTAAAFLGFGLGSEYAVTAYLVSRAFGVRAFGAIYGLITTATSIGAALGASILGAALVSSVPVGTIAAGAIAVLLVPILLLFTISRDDLPFRA